MSIGISYSAISMHLIMVFLIKIARKITAFNKICNFVIFNKSRQYGIRQNGIGNMVFGNLVLIHSAMSVTQSELKKLRRL